MSAVTFADRLIASDKRRWVLTIKGVRFALVRSEPRDLHGWVNPRKPIAVVDTWTLHVLGDPRDDGTVDSTLVHVALGLRMNPDPKKPSLAWHTQHRLRRCLEVAQIYAEGWQRLAVMLDQHQASTSKPTGKHATKIRKMQATALLDLRYHRVIVRQNTVALVAGDAVLIARRAYNSDEWIELVYRVGDRAVHGSYNLAYTGEITSISPKTITVVDRLGQETKRMKHDRFVAYNDSPISAADERNLEWYRTA